METNGKLVLVTGAAGAIGRPVCRELKRRGHQVRAFDRVQGTPEADWVIGDLIDRNALDEAMSGVDVVIHLAATPNDKADFLSDLLPNNIAGTYNVLEAAKDKGVKRLVITSSIQVVNRLTRPGHTVLAEDGTGPTNLYGVAKVCAEQMGYVYAHAHDISVIVVRPGWLPRVLRTGMRAFPHAYLSPGDAGRFFADCVDSRKLSAPGFEILFALSQYKGRRPYETARAKQLIGYEPRDTWPEGSEEIPRE